jgi:membrane protease YdiL (CAAX protease family)
VTALPPPIPGTAIGPSPSTGTASTSAPTLPLVAAVGAMGVLSGSLIVSKYLLDSIVEFGWPVAVYVALLALVGYGPSLWWCRYASRRWGTGSLGTDIGLTPRFADLGWGPVIWLGAIGAQVAVGAVVVALGVPLVGNTEGIEEISADRTYVVSLVITAVIAAPIVEEMVFRGVVMRGLRSRLPIVATIILQGLLFGAAHVDPVRGVGNVGLVLVLGGVGIAFGISVALLGRIGPAMVAHALFNGAVLLIVLSGVADRLDDQSAASVPADVSTLTATSVGEQVGGVDQADFAEAGGEGDAHPAGSALVVVEATDGTQRVGVEDGDVVEVGERLAVDRPSGSVDDVGHARLR